MLQKTTFNTITLEGFGSFHNETTFNLNTGGITLIFGDNGHGKTTMFSGLSWALFKVNLKGTTNDKVATWSAVRTPDFRGTRVMVDFNVGEDNYIIARHIKYKGTTFGVQGNDELLLLKNGQLDANQHKGDTEQEIEKILGINSKVFLNSAIFGQRMKRLVEADPKEKRELLETLFEMDFINSAKDRASAEEAKLQDKNKGLENAKALAETSKQLIVDEIDRHKKVVADFEENRKTRLINADKAIADKESEILGVGISLENSLANIEKRYTRKEADNKIILAEQEAQLQAQKPPKKVEKSSKELEALKDALATSFTALRELKEKIAQYGIELRKSNGTILTSQDKIAKYEKDLLLIKDTCPTCGVKFSDTHKIEDAKKELNSFIKTEEDIITKEQEVIAVLTEKSQEVQDKLVLDAIVHKGIEDNIATFEAQIDAYNDFTKANAQLLQEIEVTKAELANLSKNKQAEITEVTHIAEVKKASLQATLKSYIELKDEIELSVPPVVDLDELYKKIDNYSSRVLVLNNDIETNSSKLERLAWWRTKAFGASGIKTYIFNAMLEKLNLYAERYTSRLGLAVKFEVDMSKASKPFLTRCFVEGIEADYDELSGGQKQRIDICLSFALHDLIGHKSDINILVLDEVFENLDRSGVEAVFDLIQVKASTGRSVFVITHLAVLDTSMAKSYTVALDDNKHSYIY